MPDFAEMFTPEEFRAAYDAKMFGETHALFDYFPCPDFSKLFDDQPILAKGKAEWVPLGLLIEAERRLAHLAPEPVAKGKKQTPEHVSHRFRVTTLLVQLIYQALYDDQLTLTADYKGSQRLFRQVLGHIWGPPLPIVKGLAYGGQSCAPVAPATGPVRARVMAVGKLPGPDEEAVRRNMVGASGAKLREVASKSGCSPDEWYVTNAIRWPHPDPKSDSALPASWSKTCYPLLRWEIELVKPDYLLLMGNEALKAVMGNGATQDNCQYRLLEYKATPESTPVKTLSTIHPAYVARRPDKEPDMIKAVSGLTSLLSTGQAWVKETDQFHLEVRTLDQLRNLGDLILQNPNSTVIAFDCEWHGQYPGEPDAFLRTVQFSWDDKTAAAVVLHDTGGVPVLWDHREEVVRLMSRFCHSSPGRTVRVVGHNLNADLPWLRHLGLDLLLEFIPPAYQIDPNDPSTTAGAELTKTHGGFDTMLAAHAVRENDEFKLELLGVSRLGLHRYDEALIAWKKSYLLKHKMKAADLDGYGECLHKDSKVRLADGSWQTIAKLVRDRYDGEVLAIVDGRISASRVTNWHRNDYDQKIWFKLKTISTDVGRHGLVGPRFTPNHRILTARGKVRVDALVAGEDVIVTDEPKYSEDQLSVLLACGLGDGGFRVKSAKGVAFGFGQSSKHAEYAEWKASVFSEFVPSERKYRSGAKRYELPVSRQLYGLLKTFPRKEKTEHSKRKLLITQNLLDKLGVLGLAVWYQDDGSLVSCGEAGRGYYNSRIYCAHVTDQEQALVISWLTSRFGPGVSYNRVNGFFQLSKQAHKRFHEAIAPYVHPSMAHKTFTNPSTTPVTCAANGLYAELIEEVIESSPPASHKGNDVRYCLTTTAGNFLTQVGFVSNCPAEILIGRREVEYPFGISVCDSYACYDPDATRRLFVKYNGEPGRPGLLDRDDFGNSSRIPFWRSMIATLAFGEFHTTGVCVDLARAAQLSELYQQATQGLVEHLRSLCGWVERRDESGKVIDKPFNPNSVFHVRELLFGVAVANRRNKADNSLMRSSPEHVVLADVFPHVSTGKKPKLWEDVVAKGEQNNFAPSTGKEALQVLAGRHPYVDLIRGIRVFGQLLKFVMRPPDEKVPAQAKQEEILVDDDDDPEFSEGMMSFVLKQDGRVHSQFFQTKETGRCSSARPPMQNLSKSAESNYEKLFRVYGPGGSYQEKNNLPQPVIDRFYSHPVRSVVRAKPGHKLVDVDWTGAELAIAAWQAADKNMIEHVARAQLDESDPNFYDIHSNVAVRAFKLTCAPTKKGLADAGYKSIRTAAKACVFGTMYGQQADALARKAKQEGVDITPQEAQMLIDGLFSLYPALPAYLDEASRRALNPRFLVNCFGRRRRFEPTDDRKTAGEFERQAKNFPIQSAVADAMNMALHHLYWYRYEYNRPDTHWYTLNLQVHDAAVLEVPDHCVDWVVEEVLPECMSKRVPVWSCRLDGSLNPQFDKPFHLQAPPADVFDNWSVGLKRSQCLAAGISSKYALKCEACSRQVTGSFELNSLSGICDKCQKKLEEQQKASV